MNAHQATISWNRGDSSFTDRKYSRAHVWRFDGGATVEASASPHIVRPPYSAPEAVDPEEAFVAALSSCHMLWFLDFASRAGYVVDSYEDQALGTLAKDSTGRLAMTEVVLRPQVIFGGDKRPSSEAHEALHHQAHESCFLASSVKTSIRLEVR